jgi:CubicO group peptidase (beta-lactamase class C family)
LSGLVIVTEAIAQPTPAPLPDPAATSVGALTPERPYLAMSVTKSFVGMLAAILMAEGKLDPAAPVAKYLPEMKDTAHGDATVRQAMDMTIGVKYSEHYADPKAVTAMPSPARRSTPK